MKIITKTITHKNNNNKENKKHLVYFFGLGESIKSNNENSDFGKWVQNKNIDIHMFDYHYMESQYPEHFHDAKFHLKQVLVTAIVTSIIAFAGYSIIASQIPMLLKVLVFAAFLIPAIIATIAMIFYPLVVPIIKFITKGNDPIKAGMAIVKDLLEKGVHPDDIILMGNSLGGGIAAEVLKKFEEENIYFTLIHSNSYDSWKNVPRSQKSPIGTLFKRISIIVDIWFKLCSLNYKPNEIIKSTKAPVLATNRIGDVVIDEAAHSVLNLQKSKDDFKDKGDLKVTALLKHNKSECFSKNNPHVDQLTHMVVGSIDSLGPEIKGLDKDQPYEELLSTFINKAHQHLKEKGLNKNFNLDTFKQSKLCNQVKKNDVLLIDVDNPNSNVTSSSYEKTSTKTRKCA